MTQYSDVPQANALYLENEQVNRAIELIDGGGQMSLFTIAPGPPKPDTTTMVMAVSIAVPPPVPPVLMADVRQWLVDRSDALLAQLAALNVTEPPPAQASKTSAA